MSVFSGDFDQGPLVDPTEAQLAELTARTEDNGHVQAVQGGSETAEQRVGLSQVTQIRYIPLPTDSLQANPHTADSHNIQADSGTSNVGGDPQGARREGSPSRDVAAIAVDARAGPDPADMYMQIDDSLTENSSQNCGISLINIS